MIVTSRSFVRPVTGQIATSIELTGVGQAAALVARTVPKPFLTTSSEAREIADSVSPGRTVL